AETSAATASLAARVTVPEASSDSASISQHAAMTGGTGEWRITGGASMPKSRSSPAYTSATSPRAARGRTGVTWRTCASAPGAVIRLSVLPTAASSVAQQGRDQGRGPAAAAGGAVRGGRPVLDRDAALAGGAHDAGHRPFRERGDRHGGVDRERAGHGRAVGDEDARVAAELVPVVEGGGVRVVADAAGGQRVDGVGADEVVGPGGHGGQAVAFEDVLAVGVGHRPGGPRVGGRVVGEPADAEHLLRDPVGVAARRRRAEDA